MKRRQKAKKEQEKELAEKELRRKLRMPKYADGKSSDENHLTDQQYYAIMEKVAEENNSKWNKLRLEEGGRPLSVNEDYLRILNDNSYDYRGYYNKYPQSAANADTHWPDEFKTVWHPLFSDESIYSGKKSQYNPKGIVGGHWYGDNFVPSVAQFIENNVHFNKYADGKPAYTYIKPLSGVGVDEDGNLRDPEVPSAKGSVLLPEVTVTARDPRKYVSAFNGNQEYLDDMIGFVPVAGDLNDAANAGIAAYNGDYSQAAMLTAGLLLPNAVEKPLKQGLRFFKKLPINPNRYYRAVDRQALDSYKRTGVISQYDPSGGFSSRYEYPMFTKGEPSTFRLDQGDYNTVWVVSKPKSKLKWESVNGAAMSPTVNGEFNKAPISNFDFYLYHPNKGYLKLDSNLNMPNGMMVSRTPHIDYLNGLSKEDQIKYLTDNGLNDQWLWTLKNNPDHLESALKRSPIPGYADGKPSQQEIDAFSREVAQLNNRAIGDYADYVTESGNTYRGIPYIAPDGQMYIQPEGQQEAVAIQNPNGVQLKKPTYHSAYHPEDVEQFFNTSGVGLFFNPFRLARTTSDFLSNPSLNGAIDIGHDVLPWSKGGRFLLGAYNLANENGIAKTWDLFNKGEYGRASLSGLGDLFNAAMAAEGGSGIAKQLQRKLTGAGPLSLAEEQAAFVDLYDLWSGLKSTVVDLWNRRRGLFRQAKNAIFPKKHDDISNILPVEKYTEKARIADRRAQDIFLHLNDDSPYLIRAHVNEQDVPSGYRFRFAPAGVVDQHGNRQSLHIDGVPIFGDTEQYVWSTGGKVKTPRYGGSYPEGGNVIVESVDGEYIPLEFTTSGLSDKVFSIRNNPDFDDAIAENIAKIERETGAPVVGSSRLISEGYIGGTPGDVEIIVPNSQVRSVSDKLKFRPERRTAGNTGITGSSDVALRGPEPNNLDINILEDTGTIIHQMESTRRTLHMPEKYSEHARQQKSIVDREDISNSIDLKIPKEDGSGYYTAEEYFDIIKKDPELLTQSVIDNAFKSDKDKHIARAFVMMNDSRPKTVDKVSTAIDHMVAQIPGTKRFSQMYKAQTFDDVAANKEILRKIGFAPFDVDKFASNPQQMKNIVDYWYMRQTIGARSVNFLDTTGGDSFENVMSAVRSYDNGDSAGGGGNTILGGKYGGFTRTNTSYSEYEPVVDKNTATFDDVFNAFERERTIWNDNAAVEQAIKDVAKEYGIDYKDVVNNNSYKNSSTFTTRVTDLVNAGLFTHKEANEFVQKVAQKLGVSGFRGSDYGQGSRYVGKYFGGMQKPKNVAYRNIDNPDAHNQPLLPAEFGSDKMFFANDRPSNSSARRYTHVTKRGKLRLDEAAKVYPQNVIDMTPYHQLAEQIEKAKPHHIKLQRGGGYESDVLAEASGVKKTRAHFKEMEDTYNRRLDKHYELMQKYWNNRRKRSNTRNTIFATAGISSAMGFPLGVAILGDIKSKRDWSYYEQHKDEINKQMKDKFGFDFHDEHLTDRQIRKGTRFLHRVRLENEDNKK